MAVYVVFAIVCASTQLSIFALTGVKEVEWMEVCSKFMRFCIQIGGSIACGFVASAILALRSIGLDEMNM
ncbi:CASP-like protein 2C1 [Bienertia sinuspersici]